MFVLFFDFTHVSYKLVSSSVELSKSDDDTCWMYDDTEDKDEDEEEESYSGDSQIPWNPKLAWLRISPTI